MKKGEGAPETRVLRIPAFELTKIRARALITVDQRVAAELPLFVNFISFLRIARVHLKIEDRLFRISITMAKSLRNHTSNSIHFEMT